MYISSDGSEKEVKQMNSEYIINAISKNFREVFTSTSLEEYEKYANNIEILISEMFERINQFVDTDGEEW